MDANVKLGRVFGISVGLHWSWFLIFLIVTWSLALGIFERQLPGLSLPVYWSLGAVTSILLFTSVLAHEFGHALVSIRNHIPVHRITLFIFGGVAQIAQEPKSAGVEFRIAIAGPVVSLALAALFETIFLLSGNLPVIHSPAEWLAQVNLTLVLFNMLPGFPLDGGRVLRAILWSVTHNFQKATRIATYSGQVVAFGFAGFGVFSITGGNFANGLWLMFIGWFLFDAAAASRFQANRNPAMEDVRVTQIMDRRVTEVASSLTLCDLVEDKIVQGGHRSFLVSENHHPVGLVTIRDIISIPRTEWPRTMVSQIMVPWSRLMEVSPDAALAYAFQRMEVFNLTNMPVVANNHVEGLLTREQVLRYLRMRSGLGV
jgi:Zn-dependent protease/CBS domain-containing protein